MEDSLWYGVLVFSSIAVAIIARQALTHKLYPGIPFNEISAVRILGDIPHLKPILWKTQEFSDSVFAITTRQLQTPIAQLLLPSFTFRKPLIVLEDPKEIEDILNRRESEFGKATMAVEIFEPMFPHSTNSMYTTSELREQKRLWSTLANRVFLKVFAAPHIYEVTLELIALWQLKASRYDDQGFDAMEDFQHATLDMMWLILTGQKCGLTKSSMGKLQNQVSGIFQAANVASPPGAFVKDEVTYICDTITKNTNALWPKWAQSFETLTPRYKEFRATLTRELGAAMMGAVQRFQHLELGELETGPTDTTIIHTVLRRKFIQAKKANMMHFDPFKDQNISDEMFVMLVGGYDSTSSVLAWFVRFMEAYPDCQKELRRVLTNAFPGPDLPSVDKILNTRIPYVDATCEETFRLAGVAKANLREALCDTHILNCPIPKGAQILLNFHIDREPIPVDRSRGRNSSHNEPQAPDLAIFEPRRWLGRETYNGEAGFDRGSLPSLAFGGGYRGCPDKTLPHYHLQPVRTGQDANVYQDDISPIWSCVLSLL